MDNLPSKFVHVAVALFLCKGNVLIAKRHDNTHQGGKWEFPGGKVEAGESVFAALQRECMEELGVYVLQAKPFMQQAYTYPEKSVLLDVWQVDAFYGDAQALDSQAICWVPVSELSHYDFPEPNRLMISEILRVQSRHFWA